MTTQTTDDICLTGVSKIFATGIFTRKVGVIDLDLRIPRGEVVGLLGPNGSGKSTTIKMILGFIKPNRGEILVCGHLAGTREARAIIGYLPENPRFQRFLKAREILRYYGKLLSLKKQDLSVRVDYLLELVGLKEAANERIHGFSKGMTQRLAVAQSLLNEPRLLIFDEPMSGLDPLGRIEIRKLVTRIHDELPNTTIFFSTHILSDVQELCSSVALLKRGRLQRHCTIRELLGEEASLYHLTVRDVPAEVLAKFAEGGEIHVTPLGTSLLLHGGERLMLCLSEVKLRAGVLVGIESVHHNLEQALYSDLIKNEKPLEMPRQAGGLR